MNDIFFKNYIALPIFFISALFIPLNVASSQTTNINVSELLPRADLFVTPQSGTFIEGTTFDVSVYVDTKSESINTINLNLRFDPSKLQIVRPLGGRSIIGIWLEPPNYSNSSGSVHLIGTIPNGIVTESGLITTITFKPIMSGTARVWVSDTTEVLANDGLGTSLKLSFSDARYSIGPIPPGGVRVFSDTHTFNDKWYNNNNPSFFWEKEDGVSGFSYVLDNNPFTTPDNETYTTSNTLVGFENLPDGLWYFHIKSKKQNIWGTTTHFLARIDTTPPAQFTPTIDTITAAVLNSRGLVSFFTTDTLSGIDHYEVGVIPPGEPLDSSPAYVEARSPYQIPGNIVSNTHIIVRAYDRASNVQSATLTFVTRPLLEIVSKNNLLTLLGAFIFSLLVLFLLFFLYRHNIKKHTKKIANLAERHEGLSSPPNKTTHNVENDNSLLKNELGT